MAKRLNLSLCLDDFEGGFATYSFEGKNGKHYLNLTVWENDKPSQYGDTHTVQASIKNEDGTWTNRIVGHMKPADAPKQQVQEQAKPAPQPQAKPADDLFPF